MGEGEINCVKRHDKFLVMEQKLGEVLKELESCKRCQFVKSSDLRIIDRVVEAKKLVGLERGLMEYGIA